MKELMQEFQMLNNKLFLRIPTCLLRLSGFVEGLYQSIVITGHCPLGAVREM